VTVVATISTNEANTDTTSNVSYRIFVWLFFFTSALLAVVYVSYVEDRFLLIPLVCYSCLSKHYHRHSNAMWFSHTNTHIFVYIHIYIYIHVLGSVIYIYIHILICIYMYMYIILPSIYIHICISHTNDQIYVAGQ